MAQHTQGRGGSRGAQSGRSGRSQGFGPSKKNSKPQGTRAWSSEDGRQWRSPDGRKAGIAGKVAASPKKGAGKAGRGGKGFSARGAKGNSSPRISSVDSKNLVEGRRAVDEVLAANIPIKRALIAVSKGNQDPKLARMAAEFEAEGIRVDRVSKARLDGLSSHGAHQGIMVELAAFPYADIEDILSAAGDGDALIVVLDHVVDEGNLGAIVRSAEVVGASGVIIARDRAASVGVGAYKTSAGAVFHVPIAQVPNIAKAVDRLKEAGFWAGAASEHAADTLWSAPMGGRFCLVMGSEGDGVSRLVMDRCDFSCRLPQRGQVESLNVAQAATVMAYEWLRRTTGGADTADLEEAKAQDTYDPLGDDTGIGSFEAAEKING